MYCVSKPRSSGSSWCKGVAFGISTTGGSGFSLSLFQSSSSDCICHMLAVPRLVVLLCGGCSLEITSSKNGFFFAFIVFKFWLTDTWLLVNPQCAHASSVIKVRWWFLISR